MNLLEKFPEGKKMGNLIVSDNLTNEHWATLQDLHAPMPYSPKVAKVCTVMSESYCLLL